MIRLFSFFFASLLIQGCQPSKSSLLKNLVRDANRQILLRLQKVENQIAAQSKKLQSLSEKELNGGCVLNRADGVASSLYLPKSSPESERYRCTMAAAKGLEEDWVKMFSQSDYLSWVYVFDGISKAMRIHPPTNTRALFGENLIFDQFAFYRNAIKSYPESAWSPLKYDINGTGKIVIHSTALDLNKNGKADTVLSVDVQAGKLLSKKNDEIFSHFKGRKSDFILVIGITLIDQKRGVSVFDYTTSQAQRNILIRDNEEIFAISSLEHEVLFAALHEALAGKKWEQSQEFQFNQNEFLCFMDRLDQISLVTMACIKK